jgi:hypothetical protein
LRVHLGVCGFIPSHFQPTPLHAFALVVTTLALGSRPRQGFAKVRAKNELGSHISCSQECKKVWRNEPHTPKWAPILGVEVPMDFRIFRGWLQGSKLIGLKNSLYHWKALGTLISKMGLHDSFGYIKHKLWPKEGPRVKLSIWLPITTSRESPWFPCVQVACHISLESPRQRLQFCFRPHLNRRSAHKVMGLQNCESPRTKWHLGVGPVTKNKIYYKGEDDGFPQIWAVVNLVSLCLPVACPCTKTAPAMH